MKDQDEKTQQGTDAEREATIRDLDPSEEESDQVKGGAKTNIKLEQ